LCFRGIVTKAVPSQESERSSHFPGLVQLRLGNDTLKTQIYDLSLSWLGTGLVTIPLKHKYMTSREVIYLCFRGIVTKPVPSQES
jgi:hypothetical protein